MQQEALRYIAKNGPINVSEITELFPQEVLQHLIHRHFIITVGPKVDVYWDIFKDYLNTGKISAEESYILRTSPRVVLSFMKVLKDKKKITLKQLSKILKRPLKSLYNIIKDIKILGLIDVHGENISPKSNFKISTSDILVETKKLAREKFFNYKILVEIQNTLVDKEILKLEEIGDIMQNLFPYIRADNKTWITYARKISEWLDFTDFGSFDGIKLKQFNPDTDIKSMDKFIYKMRGEKIFIPKIQYEPIEQFMEEVFNLMLKRGVLSLKTSRMKKAFNSAVGIGFLQRERNVVKFTPLGIDFVKNPALRAEAFAKAIKSLKVAQVFLEIIQKKRGLSVSGIAREFNNAFNRRWSVQSSITLVKILLNWCKHANLISKERAFYKKVQQPLFNE